MVSKTPAIALRRTMPGVLLFIHIVRNRFIMALYRPDYKLKEARQLIESLDNSKENELIKYLISKKDEQIDNQNKQLDEYRTWFKQLDRFLPNKNRVLG